MIQKTLKAIGITTSSFLSLRRIRLQFKASTSSKFKASGLKKANVVPIFSKVLVFEKFNINSRQKNSDRTTQQPSSIFGDEINNSTVNIFNIFQQNCRKFGQNTDNVNKNSNYLHNFKPR